MLKTINRLLNEVQEEYDARYVWGYEAQECRSLFRKIRIKIEQKIMAQMEGENALSVEEVLKLVENFEETWENRPTDCDDTDGRIHIRSIYSKLKEHLEDEMR
jgi:hypothetical protein